MTFCSYRTVAHVVAVAFCLALADSRSVAQTPPDKLSADVALQAVEADLSQEGVRGSRWRSFLDLDRLRSELTAPGSAADAIDHTTRQLQTVQRIPSRAAVQRLLDALYQFSKDPQTGAQTLAQVADLRQHISVLGRRGEGWSRLLPLDELEQSIGNPQLEDALWRGEFFGHIEFLEAELRARDQGRIEALRRALVAYKAEREATLTDALAQSVRRAKSTYRAATADELESSRRKLAEGMSRLESFLAHGTPENADRWKAFLLWEDLEVVRDPSDPPRLSKLARVFQKLQSGYPGLNLPVFRRVAGNLQGYLEHLGSYDSRPMRIAEAKHDLEQAVQHLQGFLATAQDQRQQGWIRYLRLNALDRLLADESQDVRELAPVLQQFESSQPGLELRPFRHVNRRLAKYMELLALQQRPDYIDQIDARLEKLARDIEADSAEPSPATFGALRETWEWMDSANQFGGLRQELRTRFSSPNLYVRVSSDFVQRALSNDSQNVNPVAMWFFGAWVTGASHSNVFYQPRLIPSPDRVLMELVVQGNSVSNTVGRQRRVSVFAQGHTGLYATKLLVWDGIRISSAPADARASTRQAICGVHVDRHFGRRLISRFALRRANRLQPCAEQVADCQARQLLSQQFDRQTAEMLRTANGRLADLQVRLRQDEIYPDALFVNSTSNAIQVRAQTLAFSPFTAPSAPPQIGESTDVLLQVHESLLNNLLSRQMRGARIDSETIVERLEELNLPVPPELGGPRPSPESAPADPSLSSAEARAAQPQPTAGTAMNDETLDEPWSMQFDQTRPVAVGFRDGKVTITVRGSKFTRGDQKIDDIIDITATYRFFYVPQRGLLARREGDLDIKFASARDRLTTRQIAHKTFLARRFGGLFRAEMSADDLPPGELRDQAKQLVPEMIYSREGWLSMGANVTDTMLATLDIGT